MKTDESMLVAPSLVADLSLVREYVSVTADATITPAEIRGMLSRLHADKLARHPEAIGLGGVVRPGDGLKNPPPIPGTTIRP